MDVQRAGDRVREGEPNAPAEEVISDVVESLDGLRVAARCGSFGEAGPGLFAAQEIQVIARLDVLWRLIESVPDDVRTDKAARRLSLIASDVAELLCARIPRLEIRSDQSDAMEWRQLYALTLPLLRWSARWGRPSHAPDPDDSLLLAATAIPGPKGVRLIGASSRLGL